MAQSLLFIVLLLQVAHALNVDEKPAAKVVTPELVIPGEWLTDKAENFLFLPLTIPADLKLAQCKLMTNGESLLVVVTQTPEEEPDSKALRKYKLVIEAIKKEAMHDETMLTSKLQTWLETEDDDEVKVRVKATLDSLKNVVESKKTNDGHHKAVSVPLGGVPKSKASLLELESAPAPPVSAVLRGVSKHIHHNHHAARIIKESFAVEVPYPVPTENIVLIRVKATTLMVAMPLVRKSLEAKGISTGGKPFLRVPVFSEVGTWIAGPKAVLSQAVASLNVATVVSQAGFAPLSD